MRRPPPVIVGFIGLVLSSALAVRVISEFDGDPTIFAAFAGESATTAYAENKLGRDVVIRSDLGHDGKFFFVLANDPWLSDPEENALILDRPRYRAQRMLYPLLSGGGGFLPAEVLIWSLVAVNVIAMGVGTWAVAALALDMAGSPWWGLAFVLNLGLVSEMNIDGAGVVAATTAFWAIVMIRKDSHTIGIALLAASALSREVMLIVAAGTALWLWRHGRRRVAAATLLVPIAGVGIWALYVRLRLGGGGDGAEIQEIGLPFVGLLRAVPTWLDPIDLAAGVSILLLLLLFARRAILSSELVGWAFVGFVPVAFLFTRQVWTNYFDISRAVAPVITAFLLLVFVAGDHYRRQTRGRMLHGT